MDKEARLEKILHKLTGCRVKAARVAEGWTQERLAEALGISDRQTVSDIERGKRALKSKEMMLLPNLFERDLEFFLDPFSVAGEAQFSWRTSPEIPEGVLDEFEQKACRWVGLLRWMQEKQGRRRSAIKRSLRLSHQSSYEDAQECAESLVSELSLGTIPADGLSDKIEQELGIPVLFVDAAGLPNGKSISGATCHLEEMNVILINRGENETRRAFNLAHELFHAMTWDAMKPERRVPNSSTSRKKSKRIEQMADNFAAGLLMPCSSLDRLIPRERLTDIKHLCLAAKVLQVAPSTLGWRLFNLKLIDEGTRRTLARKREPRESPSTPDHLRLFSPTYVRMLHDALDKGWISARKAANATGTGLDGLIDMFIEYGYAAPYEL